MSFRSIPEEEGTAWMDSIRCYHSVLNGNSLSIDCGTTVNILSFKFNDFSQNYFYIEIDNEQKISFLYDSDSKRCLLFNPGTYRHAHL